MQAYYNSSVVKPKQMIDSDGTKKTSAKPLHTITTHPSHRLHLTSLSLEEVEDSDRKNDAKDIGCRKQKAKEIQNKAQLQQQCKEVNSNGGL